MTMKYLAIRLHRNDLVEVAGPIKDSKHRAMMIATLHRNLERIYGPNNGGYTDRTIEADSMIDALIKSRDNVHGII